MAQLPSLADAPNTLREYETIYILKPDTNNDKVGEVNTKVKTIIEERGGQVLNVDNWGKRKLAYEIKKERKGIYLFWQFLGNPDIVAEFERNMRMMDPVMRYLTIKLDTDVKTGSRESEVSSDTYEKAASTAADEEEIATGRAAEGAAEGDAEVKADAPKADAEVKADAAEAPAETKDDTEVKADAEAPAETKESTEEEA